MSDHLPQEVWRDILTRLPVKSIGQMRLVSKQFHSLISDPTFITAHLNRPSNNKKLLIGYRSSEKKRNKKDHYLILNDEVEKLQVKNGEKIICPFDEVSLNHNCWIVGSCNGLVCLCKRYSSKVEEIILWNPSIRKYIILPEPQGNKHHANVKFILGFGFDPKSDDYKVVKLTFMNGSYLTELYSLSSSSWRIINNIDNPTNAASSWSDNVDHGTTSCVIDEDTWPQAFLYGVVHWIGYEYQVTKLMNVIVSFNLSDEIFGKIMLPDVLKSESTPRLSISVIKNMLSVSQYQLGSGKEWYSIWAMEEYGQVNSWTKLYTIDLHPNFSKMIDFRKNGEVIMVTKKGKLVVYDPNSQRTRNIGISDTIDIDSLCLVKYVDSLLLLDIEANSLICGGEFDSEVLPLAET